MHILLPCNERKTSFPLPDNMTPFTENSCVLSLFSDLSELSLGFAKVSRGELQNLDGSNEFATFAPLIRGIAVRGQQ